MKYFLQKTLNFLQDKRETETDREKEREREIERDFYFLKVRLGDSNRQPQPSRKKS